MNIDIKKLMSWIEENKIFSQDKFLSSFSQEIFDYAIKEYLIMHVGENIFEECITGSCYNVAEVIALTQPTKIVTSEAALNFYDLGNRDFTDVSFIDSSNIHIGDWCVLNSRNNSIRVKIVTLNYLLLDLLCDIQKEYIFLEEIEYAFSSLTIPQICEFEIYLKNSSRKVSIRKKEVYEKAKLKAYGSKEWNKGIKI